MLDITQLNCSLSMQAATGISKPGPQLEVFPPADSPLPLSMANPQPMVTWRVTRSCNLNCLNCLSDSRPRRPKSELSTPEGRALISDLAAFQVPRLLFAGGEPLLRADLLELVAYARERRIQPSLLTNGTLLSPAMAAGLKRAGMHSVTILLEGIGRKVDRHRGMRGAFDAILDGYANCEAVGLAAEIRTPLNRWIYPELEDFLDFIERRPIRKVVFAHLVYTGRGNSPQDDLTHDEKRRALALLEDGCSYAEVSRTLGRSEQVFRNNFPGYRWTVTQAAESAELSKWVRRIEKDYERAKKAGKRRDGAA